MVLQASEQYVLCIPLCGGMQGMSWKKTLEQTQNMLEGLYATSLGNVSWHQGEQSDTAKVVTVGP